MSGIFMDAVKQPDAEWSSYDMIGFAIRNLFFKVSSVDIGICMTKNLTGHDKNDYSDLYFYLGVQL